MPDAMLSSADPRFHAAFNRTSFLFNPDFAHHALYDLDSFIGLVRRVGPHQAFWSNRPADLADGWTHVQARERSMEAAVAPEHQLRVMLHQRRVRLYKVNPVRTRHPSLA